MMIKNNLKHLTETLIKSAMNNFEIIPPQALDLEEAVLGAMLVDNDKITLAFEILIDGCFYSETNKIIFQAIEKLYKKHEAIDILTVRDELVKVKKLNEIGGALYLTKLINRVASSEHIEFHARILKQKFIQRELIRISNETSANCYNDEKDIDDILQENEKQLETLNNFSDEKPCKTLKAIGIETLEIIRRRIECFRNNRLTGISTGIYDLNKITNGWQNDLIIIAARPSIGKSSFIYFNIKKLCEKIYFEKTNEEVILFSLETSNSQVNQKLLLSEFDNFSYKFKCGNISQSEFEKSEKIQNKIDNYNLTMIDDIFELNELIKKVRFLKRKFKSEDKKIKAIFIDYLQLMNVNDLNKNYNKNNEIGEITKRLKKLQKEIDCPVILLSQLNRNLEKNIIPRRPLLADLRESGNIEQDADVVVLLHRPGKGNLEEPQDIIEFIIAKHREGELGIVKAKFAPDMTNFFDLSDEYIDNYNKKIEDVMF